MPIRINLMAEALELEESRRRDPVKRAIYVACVIIALVLVWSASKQVLIIAEGSRLNGLEAQIKAKTAEFDKVMAAEKRLKEIQFRLDSLTQLATNRLLTGNLLNALQNATVDDIELMRLRVEQAYTLSEGTKPKTNDVTGHITAGKPPSATEKIIVTLDARDSSARSGEQANKWREALADSDFFGELLGRAPDGKTNEFRLTSLSPPQISPTSAKPFRNFTLEGRVPDRVR
jgi:hypothetical protein